MNTPEDPIEKLLREQETYIEDNGFTARVLGRLPPRRYVWLRRVILLGAAATGAFMAAKWLPLGDLPAFDITALPSKSPEMLLTWLPLLAIAAALYHAVSRGLQPED